MLLAKCYSADHIKKNSVFRYVARIRVGVSGGEIEGTNQLKVLVLMGE